MNAIIDEMRLSKHQRYTKMRAGNHSAETGTAQEACRREQLRYFFDGKTPPSNKSAATGGGGAPSSAISTVAAGAAGAPGAGAGARGLPESAPEGAGPAPLGARTRPSAASAQDVCQPAHAFATRSATASVGVPNRWLPHPQTEGDRSFRTAGRGDVGRFGAVQVFQNCGIFLDMNK